MNPFLLDLPAVVSFSGGSTSGLLLRRVLDAHGGQPAQLRVCFQNTGLEHPATLDFIDETARRWGVEITWLEYVAGPEDEHDVRVVTHATAARAGEPFTAMIAKKTYLPNPAARICTSNLKMRTMDRWLKAQPEFADGYTNAVGLRADEPHRVARIKSDNGRERIVCPLATAGISKADVTAFWAAQPFRLTLPGGGNRAGNCVGCFLKGEQKLLTLMRAMPEQFAWWAETESRTGKRFRNDRPGYAAMLEVARRQAILPFPDNEDDDDQSLPCNCTD